MFCKINPTLKVAVGLKLALNGVGMGFLRKGT
jgi:hypothetical protein